MYLPKVISTKICLTIFFVAILKVNDENIAGSGSEPDGMDPRIRIRIRTKMSWIRIPQHCAEVTIPGQSQECDEPG
jgi:hypothetical protein